MSKPDLWTGCPNCGGLGYLGYHEDTGEYEYCALCCSPPDGTVGRFPGLVGVPFDEMARIVADYYAPFTQRTDTVQMAKEALSNAIRNATLREDT